MADLAIAVIEDENKTGEMENHIKREYEVSVQDVSRLADIPWVIQTLLNSGLLLVPYDCAPNHVPTLAQGTKAHWAVITGFLLEGESYLSSSCKRLHPHRNIH